MARYGPNDAEVASLIDRAGQLTFEEAQAFLPTFSRRSDPRFTAAFDAIQQATLLSGRNQAYIAAYDDFQRAVDRSPGGRALGASTPASLIVEVATATVVRDLLAPEHYDYVIEPWRLVIDQGFRPPVDPNVRFTDFSSPAARSAGCLLPVSLAVAATLAVLAALFALA